jgi:membrane protein involved in colicin uptake
MAATENETQGQSNEDDTQEQQQNGVTPDAGNTEGAPAGEQQEQEPAAPTAEDVKKLKEALAKERSANKLTAKELATLKAEREAQNKTPEEQQIEAARREGETAAEKRANERLVKAELKAAAKGKLTNTADALVFIDLSSIEVGDDGEVDADALEAAIDNLLTERPYLGAATQKRFGGGVDQGGGKSGAPKQLTRAELANMSPEAIVAAEEKGQLANIYKTGS